MGDQFKLLERHKSQMHSSISDYVKGKVQGEGSFGKVYRAIHLKTGKSYAIKQISKYIKRTTRKKQIGDLLPINHELQVMYKLNNEFIVRIYDHFQDAQNIYIVLQLVEGVQLYTGFIQKQKKLDSKFVAKVTYQLCSALKYLHSIKIIHRDIKPQNIVITKDNNIKLLDFGTANYIQTDEIRKTKTGSLPYFAPQIVERLPHNQNVDIWCVGILLYQMSFLKTPFEHQTNTQQNILKSRIMFPSTVDPELKHLIQSILVKNPKKRLSLDGIMAHPWIKNNLEIAQLKSNKIQTAPLKLQNKNINNSLIEQKKKSVEILQLQERLKKLEIELKQKQNVAGSGKKSVDNKLVTKQKTELEKKFSTLENKFQKIKKQNGKRKVIIESNESKIVKLTTEIKTFRQFKSNLQTTKSEIIKIQKEIEIANEQNKRLKLRQKQLQKLLVVNRNKFSKSHIRNLSTSSTSNKKQSFMSLKKYQISKSIQTIYKPRLLTPQAKMKVNKSNSLSQKQIEKSLQLFKQKKQKTIKSELAKLKSIP